MCVDEDSLPAGIPEPTKHHLQVLQESFGHSAFRPMQWKIIHAVLQVCYVTDSIVKKLILHHLQFGHQIQCV